MKFPFVRRARFDLLKHNYDQLRAELHKEQTLHIEARSQRDNAVATYGAERLRFDALMEKFCAIKIAGGEIPESVVPRERKEPDAAVMQINMLSSGRPGLRAQMMKQLNMDRASNLFDEVEIQQRIEMGVVADEGVPA